MERTVFHLVEDSPFDVMEAVGRMNPKLTVEEKEQGALLLEETYMLLRKGMNRSDLSVTVKIKKRFGDINLELIAQGEAANPIVPLTEWVDDEGDLFSVNLLKANNDRMGYARRNGANIVSIRVHESENKAVYVTLFAIAMGVVFGWGLKTTLSAEMLSLLENNIASPLETMFMHAMLMMVPPVIFFSIINGLTHMSETADIGRIGKRMVVQSVILVMMVTVLSVLFGLLLFPTEMTYLAGIFERAKGTVSQDGFSLVQLIVDVVPPNLVDPFKGQNLMQILFLALFFGIVVNKLGEKARIAQELIGFMNSFCLAVMGILAKFIPFIVFITTMEMVFHTDAVTFWAMGKLVLGETFLILLVLLFFALVMALYGKMSPKIFLRKVLAFAPVPLALRSSNAALPQTLKLVTDSFGVSKSLASFALPVGTQLHQAGSCIFLALSVIMTARVFDKTFTPEFVLSMALYVFVFAYTMPPVPGGGIIALSSVFTAVGVPTEAVMVFLCVEPILDMGDTMANVSCNVTSSLLLAKKFDMLDEEIYKTE